jgi:MFS family permease
VGRASDAFGKFRIFILGSVLTIVMVIVYTNLGVTPLAGVILVSAVMFAAVSSRMIPSQALMSAVTAPASRGAFMSANAAVQQASGGIASLLAGWIVVEGKDGVLEHFDTLGYVVAGAFVITMMLMYRIRKQVSEASVSLPTGDTGKLRKNV